MFEKKSVAGIIAAAGSGTRMGGAVPKQYLEIEGVPVLVHTIRALGDAAVLDAMVVVVPPGTEESATAMLSRNGLAGTRVVGGGKHRQQSVDAGLRALQRDCPDLVLVHDAVRPCILPGLVHDVLAMALRYGASSAGVVPKDTMKVVDGEGLVLETPERARLRLIQTPQAFLYDVIVKAHRQAEQDGVHGTDDAMLVERMGGEVRIVEGDYRNIKITTPEDLSIATAWIKQHRSGRPS